MANITRRRVFIAAGVAGVAAIAAVAGQTWLGGFEELATAPVYAPDGVAIRGTDPVAYFTEGRAVPGTPEHALEWNGATWHFASAGNRAAFADDPEAYAPQYGGFCAWAVAEKGKLYSTQPDNWAIVDDKLYLNYNDDIEARWQKDIPGFIEAGDDRWPEILAAKS
ncbi:YHS domain-containing (seleno)protein [Roseovarius ramblicola]|uniref:YHS domain-containing (Seleno)protein n=1 Tax=Roseovarius ramblicola TaxID=2022336 RepID=A0ABV5I176_9RHOB